MGRDYRDEVGNALAVLREFAEGTRERAGQWDRTRYDSADGVLFKLGHHLDEKYAEIEDAERELSSLRSEVEALKEEKAVLLELLGRAGAVWHIFESGCVDIESGQLDLFWVPDDPKAIIFKRAIGYKRATSRE